MATKLIMMTVVDISRGNNTDPTIVCLIHSLPKYYKTCVCTYYVYILHMCVYFA